MPKKCCVINCNSNYASDLKHGSKKTYSVYKFPKDPEKRLSWVKAIPNSNLTVDNITENQGVCVKHWKEPIKWIKKGKFPSPDEPPNDFTGCAPVSTWGTPAAPTRSTVKSTAAARAVDIDEMSAFRELDSIKQDTFIAELNDKFVKTNLGIIAWGEDGTFTFLSKTHNGPIFDFHIHFVLPLSTATGRPTTSSSTLVYEKIQYEAYVKCRRFKHPQFTDQTNCWSMFDSLIQCVVGAHDHDDADDKSNKFLFIQRQIELLNAPKNKRIYNLNDFQNAFTWFTISRALYEKKLRSSLQLPSVSTLQNVTRAAKNMEDKTLFQSFFAKQEERAKNCILIVDEIYVRSSLQYSGKFIFVFSNVLKPDIF